MRFRRVSILLALATSLGILVAGVAPAVAHEAMTSGVVRVVQTFGLRELTVTVSPPVGGSGPMPVQIQTQGRPLDGPVSIATLPAGATAATSSASVTPRVGAPASGTLQIDHPGAWEVVLSGDADVARIPLTIPAALPTPAWAWLVRIGLVAAVAGAVGAAALAGRRRGVALAFGAVALVGAGMTVTAAVLSASLPEPATSTAMPGMDTIAAGDGAVVVTPTLARPAADGLVPLGLALTDAATGAPVDDLVTHDDALMHLAVIGPGGGLWHVHPVRVATGRFMVRLPLPAGRYGLFAETMRAGGGHQVARSAVTVAAPAVADGQALVAAPGGAGRRQVGGMQVDVSVQAPVAGQSSRVELAFSQGGQPVRDLQSWLGMAGHLMVLGPSTDPLDPGASFAHVHDVQQAVQYGYGPAIGFTYAFPAPGRYQLWAQVQRNWELLTIPITVDVAPHAAGA